MPAFVSFTKAQFAKLEGTELPFPTECTEHEVNGIAFVNVKCASREEAEHLLALRDPARKSNPVPAPAAVVKAHQPATETRKTMIPTVPNVHRDETLRKAASDPQLRTEIEAAADRGCVLSLDLAATWSEKHARALAERTSTTASKSVAASVAELEAANAAIENYVAKFASDTKISVMTAYGALATARDEHYLGLLAKRRDVEARVHPADAERARMATATAAKRAADVAAEAARTEAAKRAAADPLGVFNAQVASYAKASGIADEGAALEKFLATPEGRAAKRAYDATRAYSR